MEPKPNELSEVHVLSIISFVLLSDRTIVVHRRIELIEITHLLIELLEDLLNLRLSKELRNFIPLLLLQLQIALVHLHNLILSIRSNLLLLGEPLLLRIHLHLVLDSAAGLSGLELVLEFVFLVFEEFLASLFFLADLGGLFSGILGLLVLQELNLLCFHFLSLGFLAFGLLDELTSFLASGVFVSLFLFFGFDFLVLVDWHLVYNWLTTGVEF